MGLKGHAAIVGSAQYKPETYATAPKMFHARPSPATIQNQSGVALLTGEEVATCAMD